MIIRRYGVELRRITPDDIELVRRMRNRQDIQAYMFEQQPIGRAQQVEWFARVNTFNNYYFLIRSGDRSVGLIYGKDMDFDRQECEGGIFVWDEASRGSDVPAKASICLTEIAFEVFRMQRIHARVRADNARARHYNQALGYVPAPEKGEHYLVLTRENYERRIPFLRRVAAGGRDIAPLSADDIEIARTAGVEALYEPLPAAIREVLGSRFR